MATQLSCIDLELAIAQAIPYSYHESFEAEKFRSFCGFCMHVRETFYMKI